MNTRLRRGADKGVREALLGYQLEAGKVVLDFSPGKRR